MRLVISALLFLALAACNEQAPPKNSESARTTIAHKADSSDFDKNGSPAGSDAKSSIGTQTANQQLEAHLQQEAARAEFARRREAERQKVLRSSEISAKNELRDSPPETKRAGEIFTSFPLGKSESQPWLSDAIEKLDTSKFKALQPVYFATNRKISETPKFTLASITADRSPSMKFGVTIVSVPKNHTIGHVERPPSWFFGLVQTKETDENDFRLQHLELLPRDQLVDRLRQDADTVLLFIHGYNVPFADAVFKAAQIAYDANFAGSVLVFSWPSMGDWFKYDYDYQSALFSPGDLLGVLRMLTEEIGKKKIFVVAHSLGNQILVDALQQAALSKVSLNISELVLAAPDVDKDVFLSKAAQIKLVAGKITMYASAADKALLASDKKSWGTRLGYISATGPILVDGVETIDVTAVGDDILGLNHGTFSGSRVVLDDLGRLIVSGIHPPGVRTPTLRAAPNTINPKYWVYPQ